MLLVGKLWAQRCVGTVDAVDEEPEAAKMRVRFYKVRPMAPFLDVNVQDSRLRHRRRAVFAARDVLLLTVELCKVELCPMLVPFVGRRLFFYRCRVGLRSAWDGERRKSGVKVSSSGRRALTVVLRFRLMQKWCA